MKIYELFQGDTENRGVLTGFAANGKKLGHQQPVIIDWEAHLSGKLVQGISPINKSLNKARWLCCDIDLKIEPKEFCGKIFNKLGPEYFPFRTMGGRWRVVEFLNDWENLDFVKERSKDLEKKIIKRCGYKVDTGHTLPVNGGWVFLPYHNKETACYSPGGIMLTKEQFEFRAKYKNIPLIVSAIGMQEGTGGRPKALYNISLYKKHYPDCDINLEELNKNFADPMDPQYFQREYKHVLKSIEKDNYDKQYLLNGIPKWCADMCGFKPYIEDTFVEDVIVKELVKNFVFCNQNSDFYELETDLFRDKEQMNDWWAHHTKGKPIVKVLLLDATLKKVWSVLKHPGYTPGVIKVKPNEIPGIKAGDYLNYYKPSEVRAKAGDYHRFVEYYNWLFQSDDKIIYKEKQYTIFDVVMMFLAHLLQYPGKKIMWGILIQSLEGSGKGVLAKIIESILGPSNCLTNVSFDRLVSDHSTLIMGKQFMVINELMLTGKRIEGKELANKLKPYFTDDVHIINPKFKEEIVCPNFVNLFLYSNDPKPLHVPKDDRRLFVVKINHEQEIFKEKIEPYVEYLLDLTKDPSAIKYYLLNLELPDERFFGGHPQMTLAKKELIGYSKDDFESIMDEAFENKSFPFTYKTYADGSSYAYRGYVVIDNFFEAIKHDPLFRSVYIDRNKITLWVKSNCKPWCNGELNKEIQCSGRERRRAWLLEDILDYDNIKISQKSSSDLGRDFDKTKFISPTTRHEISSDKAMGRVTNCWACKVTISFDATTKCKKCNTGILCKCGACVCDKPIQQDIF